MKIKLIFLTVFLVGSLAAMQAQYVNEVPISELDADYVMIWSDLGPLLSSKITVRIDYGQGGRTPQITDEKRRVISFNGMIAAKAARMRAIVVPAEENRQDPRYALANVKLDSLARLTGEDLRG